MSTATAETPSTTPAAPPAPAVTPEARNVDETNIFADLDKLAKPMGDPDPPKPSSPAPKPAAEKPRQEVPPAKPIEPSKPPTAPTDEFKSAKELRTAYERGRTQIRELETKVSELTKQSTTPAEDPEKKILSERITQYEEQLKTLQGELRDTAYERSDEFKQKFDEPYKKAFERAVKGLSSVAKLDGTPIADTDVHKLLLAPLKEAYNYISEHFDGSDKRLIEKYVESVHDLNESRIEAINEAKTHTGERDKVRQAEAVQHKERVTALWQSTNKELADKYPELYKPAEGDTEGNDLLEKGFHLAKMAFSDSGLTQEQKVKVHAEILHRAAAFGRQVHRTRTLESKVKELETKLSEYEKGQPGDGEHRENGQNQTEDDPMLASLGRLDTLARGKR